MKRFLISLVFLLSLTTGGWSQVLHDSTLTMTDGVVLDIVYGVPDQGGPASIPAIVFVHGFNGSKADVRSNVQAYAGLGYATCGYSVRGQGASGGYFDFFTSSRIMEDLREVMNFTKSLPRVDPSRLGVAGASQGGLHAWGAAAHHLGARSVISIVSNGRYDENWTENDALNWLFGTAILVSPVRMIPEVLDSLRTAINAGDVARMRSYLRRYATQPLESSVTTPVLMMSSYHDQFFNPTAALRQFAGIVAPKRLLLYPGGHESPQTPGTRNVFMNLMDRWFNYWLKNDLSQQGVLAEDSVLAITDATTETILWFGSRDESVWLRGESNSRFHIAPHTLYLTPDGRLTEALEGLSSSEVTSYTPNLGSNALVFRTLATPVDVQLFGHGSSATFTVQGTGTRFQMNAFLYDVDPSTGKKTNITRGHREVPDNTPGATQQMSLDFNFHCHTLKSGHLIELRVTGGMGVLPSGSDFGNAVMGPKIASTNTMFVGGDKSFLRMNTLTSNPVSVEAVPSSRSTFAVSEVWPNPLPLGSRGGATFKIYGATDTRIQVVDAIGRVLSQVPVTVGQGTVVINTSSLLAGMYRILIMSGNARVVRTLCILQ